MAWIYLFLAGIFEVIWVIGMKYSKNFSVLLPSVITIAAMVLSMTLLSSAMRSIPLGIAYTVWTGIGATGSIIASMYMFGESINIIQMVAVTLIVISITAIKLSAN
jgi:quaternary ammonium compound-resistance protein SugE